MSNVVLNELDWWLSDQWETFNTRHEYTRADIRYAATRKTNLKEFFVVRYADDFKIVCKDYKTAQKIFTATRQWLSERLGLEINPNKSKITNVRKGKTEFLGISLYCKYSKEHKKFIVRSNIAAKAQKAMIKNIVEQIKQVQKHPTNYEASKLNSKILGMHNYYKKATLCSLDFNKINFIVSKSLHNRLKSLTSKNKEPPPKSKVYEKFYGNYHQKPIVIAGARLFPIYGCTFQIPRGFKQATCNYTEDGRKLVHDKLSGTTTLIRYLLNQKERGKSAMYNDNRISLMAGQDGKCGVTGEPLTIGKMDCHHKDSNSKNDKYSNLIWIHSFIHILIHATNPETINKYLDILKLDDKALKKVNSLRKLAGNLGIGAEKPKRTRAKKAAV